MLSARLMKVNLLTVLPSATPPIQGKILQNESIVVPFAGASALFLELCGATGPASYTTSRCLNGQAVRVARWHYDHVKTTIGHRAMCKRGPDRPSLVG